ncbi:MAG: PDZ domain-containing protein [Planctomycetes bacterium]|nr:PDZ domain-containing protein [Planctomycetota bacterium]
MMCLTLALPLRADDRQQQLQQIMDKVGPSVVTVQFTMKMRGGGQLGSMMGEQERQVSMLGVIVRADGLVLVPGNEIDPPEQSIGGRSGGGSVSFDKPEDYGVTLADGKEYRAKLLGKDEEMDLAFLQIESQEPLVLPALQFSPDAQPQIAQEVVVIGMHPKAYGFARKFKITRVNSLLEKPCAMATTEDVLNGYLGGPVASFDGQVLGIIGLRPVTEEGGGGGGGMGGIGRLARMFLGSTPGGPEPTLFPYDLLSDMITNPPKSGSKKPWIGVMGMQALTKELAETLGIPKPGGVILGEVLADSPAAVAGLRSGDILTQYNDKPVEISKDEEVAKFGMALRRLGVGAEVAFTYWRDENGAYASKTATVTLGESPPTQADMEEKDQSEVGMKVKDVTYELLQRRKLPATTKGAVVTTVERAGWAGLGGLKRGDIVQKIDDVEVKSVEELEARLKEAKAAKKGEMVFFVLRDDKTEFVHVETEWAPKGKE